MSALRNVAQGFRNLWGAADEYDDIEEHDSSQQPTEEEARPQASRARDERPEPSERDESRVARPDRFEKFTAPASSNPNYASNSNYGGGDGGARRLRSVSIPLRASREKNIYTLRPKSLEESCVAADYLKTGCAVVLNLEAVEQSIAIRVIDFMSGVCYGLEHQGHAMKLGDKIFLFTPGDFEISSDEIDYAENRDLIFKDVTSQPALKSPAAANAPAPSAPAPSANPERRSWER
ncbi:FtsZ-interacting cell division protein YlmF [Abditibacterium utsteinense]|uniref:Cell division protein SepF n=1 Tax=Abditibacterium utsteinense TaxID=1960156 RepID=A0A2S8SVD7_9BACT|nr:cell division protein SepF [Abditibacterium utsteinense]PQV64756.1 FtsZ-interacting cell division protein YlmF [Abditibacterium utsteinense]